MSCDHPVSLLKCLADETRIRIVLLIAQGGELCVCELTEVLDEGQSKISRHLAQLRTCGLLEDRRSGQWVYYSLAQSLPRWVTGLLAELNLTYADWLQSDQQRLLALRSRTTDNAANVCE